MFEMKEVHFKVNYTLLPDMNVSPVCCQSSVLIACNTISFSCEFRTFPNDFILGFLDMLHLVDNFDCWDYLYYGFVLFPDTIADLRCAINNFKLYVSVLKNVDLDMKLLWHKSLSCLIICSRSSGYCWQCRRGLIRETHCHQSYPFL